jgi:hypothetical protein
VSARCRHRDSWLIGSHYEWCYRCGALRRMRDTSIPGCTSTCEPASSWAVPVGPDGENPFSRWHDRNKAMEARRAKRQAQEPPR